MQKKKKNHVDSTMQLIEHQYIIKKKKKLLQKTIKDCSRLNKRTLWKGAKYPRMKQI